MLADKWKKHQAIQENPLILNHLPTTYLLNPESFENVLHQHGVTYLKPVVGTGGHGVIKVSIDEDGCYVVETDRRKKQVDNIHSLIRTVTRMKRKKEYLVQQGIDLLSYQGRPIDFRLLLLKPRDKWKFMGIMGKWAAPGKIVTNFCQGGEPIRLETALMNSLQIPEQDVVQIKERLVSLGFEIANTLGSRFALKEVGIDVAIDSNQELWILEVNTRPQFKLFKYHEDTSLYQKIKGYIKKIRHR